MSAPGGDRRADAPGKELGEELAREDDTIIGTAFRWSLAVVVVLGGAIGLAVWLLGGEEDEPPPEETETAAPLEATESVVPPAVAFRDVTLESGLTFVHENGARGDKLLPETMGGGVAFLDWDRDEDPDLLFVNGAPWPGGERDPEAAATMALYRNDGTGRFADATAEVGLDVAFFGMGAAAGDVDCDGDLDLFFTALGPNRLFLQEDGRFDEVEAGVAGAPDAWSTCAAFFDADGDGDLDLFVGNYVKWSREIDFAIDNRLTGIGRAYGPPMNFEGMHPWLYRTDGTGKFDDVTAEAGLQVVNPATGAPRGKALGVLPVDADGDGRLDLFVANDTVQNHLFLNRGGMTFEEAGARSGVAFDRNGSATGAMGIDAAWYRADGALGVAIGNFAGEMSSLYVAQEAPGLFVDQAIGEGLGAPSRQRLSFGIFFFDYDLDGRLDLLQANGHLEDDIQKIQPSQHYEQPAQLFWNAGDAGRHTFVEVPAEGAGDLARPIVGRGAAFADVDGDGDFDVVLTQTGGRPLLLRNEQQLGHHWVRLRVVGEGCNPDAIGATVELVAGGKRQRMQVMPTRSYLSQVETTLTFGLGATAAVERLVVRWPDGHVRELAGPEVDRLHVVGR